MSGVTSSSLGTDTADEPGGGKKPELTPELTPEQLQLAYAMATQMAQFKAGFLARISHELRSPLNGIIGMHQLVLNDLCDGPEEERSFIGQAHQAALKMVEMIDDLLLVAKAESGIYPLQIQALVVQEVLHHVEQLVQHQAQNYNLRLRVDAAQGLEAPELQGANGGALQVLADRRFLEQVLVSLVDAAIEREFEGEILLTATLAGDWVHFLLQDQRPSDRFKEAVDLLQGPPPSPVPSPGLTLLKVQSLLEAMGGRLEVRAIASGPQEFNQICCVLPVAQ